MITEFGKELRKLRIDLEIQQKEMAEDLDVSGSFLSAIESGRKEIPKGFVDLVVQVHGLGGLPKEEDLREAAALSVSRVVIDVSEHPASSRRFVLLFRDKFEHLSLSQIDSVISILMDAGVVYATLEEGTPKDEIVKLGESGFERGKKTTATLHPDDPVYDEEEEKNPLAHGTAVTQPEV